MKIMSSSINASSSKFSRVRTAYDSLENLLDFLESNPKNAESVDITQHDIDVLHDAWLILKDCLMFLDV